MGATRPKIVNKKLKTKGEVLRSLKLHSRDLQLLEEAGVFEFSDRKRVRIDSENMERLRVAAELKHEWGVNTPGIEIILHMREKLARMQRDMNKFLSQTRSKLEKKLSLNTKKLER